MLLPIPDDILQAQARERTLDLLLGGLGVSVAAVSASFAAYMIATSPGVGYGPTRVLVAQGPGVDHRSPRDREDPNAAEAADAAGQQLDFTPTGTVAGSSPTRRKEAPATGIVPDFAVRDVFDDTALVEAHGTLQMVRAGSVLPGAGEVLSITRQGGGWVVATSGGTIVQRR